MSKINTNTITKKKSNSHLKYVIKDILLPGKWLLMVGLILIAINRRSGLELPGSGKYLIDKVFANSDYELLRWLLTADAPAVTI